MIGTKVKRMKHISRIQPRNRDSNFKNLRALPSFKEIHERLISGWPIGEVARFIHEERKEYQEVTHESLLVILSEYRNSIPKGELIGRRMPPVFKKAAEQLREGMDEMQELEKLYQMQLQRISIDYSTEKKINKLFTSMTHEMRVAREILEAYAQLKMDLGINERHLGQMDLDAHLTADVAGKYGKDTVAKVLNSPSSRRRVLGVAEKLIDMVNKQEEVENTIDMVPDSESKPK